MVVPFLDSVAGTAVCINPHYVVTVRPDRGDLDRVSIVKLSDGEATRVRGECREVAEKPARTPQGCRDGENHSFARGALCSANMRRESIRSLPARRGARSA